MIVANVNITDHGSNKWSCEISDFGPKFKLGKILAINLNGQGEEPFYWQETHKDEEGDIQYWVYRASEKILTIFND